ncbi:MAG: SAM-dependent chlorinase/fluorinase [Gammaproteobacteria bacterium]|jgi:S-adenosylmethionine hydrolase
MIVLFTDYGLKGPYLGELEAAIFRYAPGERVINLFADVPRQDPRSAAYLLSAYSRGFPARTLFCCVIDPGVGSGADKPVIIRCGEHRFVGPHNGLFDVVTRDSGEVQCSEITWRPEKVSNTFHGRDIYAPVCAMLANQQPVPGKSIPWRPRHDWPEDLYRIIYIDGFGNAVSGVRAAAAGEATLLRIGDRDIKRATTFSDVAVGEAFWYENSSGLVEIAVNQGSAAEALGIGIAAEFTLF